MTDKNYFTVAELADRWGVQPHTIYVWRGQGKTPKATRFGRSIRFSLRAIEAFEKKQEGK